jgi:hypothetical protein
MRIADRFTGFFSAHTVVTVNEDNGVYEVTHTHTHTLRYCASTRHFSLTQVLRFNINTQTLTAGMVRFAHIQPL